jgi:hypothetical protein
VYIVIHSVNKDSFYSWLYSASCSLEHKLTVCCDCIGVPGLYTLQKKCVDMSITCKYPKCYCVLIL